MTLIKFLKINVYGVYYVNKHFQEFLHKGKFDINTINKFASSQNVKPGIVIGRIQNDTEDYTFMSSYRERYKWTDNI